MDRFRGLFNRYDRTIWIRVLGTIITTVTSFAIRPFLAIYLYDKTGSMYVIGIILGLSPLMGIFSNLIGGGLTDKYGRKPVMVISLLLQALSITGYVFATTPWHFCVVSMLNGLTSSLYFPAANAQITDIVPEDQRAEVFALMHSALNVGAAVGPMLGLMMIKLDQHLVFILSGVSLFINCLLVQLFIPETFKPLTNKVQALKPQRMSLNSHKQLFVFTGLALPVTLLYAVTESMMPLYLQQSFTNYLNIMTAMLTMNGIVVVLLAVYVAKRTEKLYTPYVLLVGYLLFSMVGFGYALGPWVKSIALLFVAEFIFTIGECITFPNQQKMLSVMAPPEMRGRYFSVFSMNWGIAKTIGPLFGGAMLVSFGGLKLFLSVSALLIVSGFVLVKLFSSQYRSANSIANVSR